MKRLLALVPVMIVAGCGGGAEQENKAAAAAAVTSLSHGQYEVTREVTAFRSTDNATPQINTPVGTRTSENVCVGPGAEPPAQLFAGEGSECRYDTQYMRSGRINSSLICRREGLNGELRLAVDGTFTADGFETNVETTTYFTGEGDAVFTARTTGRRTGDCPPGGAEAGNAAGAAKQ